MVEHLMKITMGRKQSTDWYNLEKAYFTMFPKDSDPSSTIDGGLGPFLGSHPIATRTTLARRAAQLQSRGQSSELCPPADGTVEEFLVLLGFQAATTPMARRRSILALKNMSILTCMLMTQHVPQPMNSPNRKTKVQAIDKHVRITQRDCRV